MRNAILNRALLLALGYSVTIGMVVPAGASQTPTKDRAAADSAKVSPPVTRLSDTASETVRQYNDLRASRLIGMFVRNPANERMGQIKDLIVDLDNARVRYAVLEFKGEVFVGKKLFVYPLTAFKSSPDGEHLGLGIEKGKLAAAPGFAPDKWPNWHARSEEIDRHFGLTPPTDAGPTKHLVRASKHLGSDVRDARGKDVGELVDLVVNLHSGKIHYAVVAFDKPWSIDDKLVAVPLSAFDVSSKGQLQVNVAREVIARAPSITRSEWPRANLAKDAWVGEVDRYALSMITPAETPDRRPPRSDVQGQRR